MDAGALSSIILGLEGMAGEVSFLFLKTIGCHRRSSGAAVGGGNA
jgi:hypothetical protein